PKTFWTLAVGLNYNEAALKDLLNVCLDDPVPQWEQEGLEILFFWGFVKYLHGRSQWAIPGQSEPFRRDFPNTSTLQTLTKWRSERRRTVEPTPEPAPVREESTPEPAPVRELTETTPEPAPVRELTECTPEPAPVRELTGSTPEPALVRELTGSTPEPAPVRELTGSTPEPAPVREPTGSTPEPAPVQEPTELIKELTPIGVNGHVTLTGTEPAPVQELSELIKEITPVRKLTGSNRPVLLQPSRLVLNSLCSCLQFSLSR
uniref:Uncharacterized protein n=1 Tax=Sinocyclocheilus anshuiensis TaxID=1608454 RepID=A0A671NDI0_9TELE